MQTREPDNNKNILLAIVLSMCVLLAWQVFYAGPRMKDEQERLKRQQEAAQQHPGTSGTVVPGGQAPVVQKPVDGKPAPVAGVGTPAQFVSRSAALAASPRVAIDTPSIKGSISLKGGRIDDIELKNYHEEVDPKSPNIVLFSPSESS